jgi:hypothetical protein
MQICILKLKNALLQCALCAIPSVVVTSLTSTVQYRTVATQFLYNAGLVHLQSSLLVALSFIKLLHVQFVLKICKGKGKVTL